MIVQCPNPDCLSDNVTNLSADSNDFKCNDCGEDFQAENGVHINEENGEASFINIDPKIAMSMANKFRKENGNEQTL